MSRNLKVFFVSLAASGTVGTGVNTLSSQLTEFFFLHELRVNPGIAAASAAQLNLEQKLRDAYPLAKKGSSPLELRARAVLALYVKERGPLRSREGEARAPKVLFEKNSETPLPIASISKLMTALVAMKNYPPDQLVTLTPAILETPGQAGQLRQGDAFTVKDLLYVSLMESSNDAAVALAGPLGQKRFVALMNQEASRLYLRDTSFVNPTGLDEPARSNTSSAADLAGLARSLFENYPQVFDILSQRELALFSPDRTFHHLMRNTNILLEYQDWPARMYGGKTGFTPQAQQTLLLLVESPDRKGYIITIILGAEDRFGEMRQLLQWILQSYQWTKITPE